MRFSRKAAGLVAVGGVAALGIGLIGASGIGAAFTSNAKATAKIDVGTFDCTLSSADDSVHISNNGHTATVDLGTITSSAPDTRDVPLTLTNTGSIVVVPSWVVTTTGNISSTNRISAIQPPTSSAGLGPNTTENLSIGFEWDELQNADLGRTGAAVYTVACAELSETSQFALFQHDGVTSAWQGTGVHIVAPVGVQGAAGGVAVVNPPASLPSTPPGFTSVPYYDGPGLPRLNIKFSDDSYAFGHFAASGPQTPMWFQVPGNTGNNPWSTVLDYATNNSLSVVKVELLVDSTAVSGGVDTEVTCFQYGAASFGTGC